MKAKAGSPVKAISGCLCVVKAQSEIAVAMEAGQTRASKDERHANPMVDALVAINNTELSSSSVIACLCAVSVGLHAPIWRIQGIMYRVP